MRSASRRSRLPIPEQLQQSADYVIEQGSYENPASARRAVAYAGRHPQTNIPEQQKAVSLI
jgi:hypothetical protein